jgi:DHA2 family multidrug resistance protein-like MFS transporter
MNVEAAAPRAGRREWLGLGVIALACLLYAMDLNVLNLALPRISADLRPSSSQLLWIVDIYGFLVAGLLITMGTLGDRIGRRRLLLTGAAAFGAASAMAAASTSAPMLIVARAVMGVAGATLAPSTLSLIRNMFLDGRQRTAAIGVWTTSFSVGSAIGPVLGGLLLQRFGWGAVFLLALPVMGLLLLLGPLVLPEYRDPRAGRLDPTSAVLSLAAVLAVIFGVKRWAQDGLGWLPVVFTAAGLTLAALFARRQRRSSDPLIDLDLFRVPALRVSLATFVLTTLVVFGSYVFIGQYLQLVLGLSPLAAGLWLLPGACGVIAGCMLAPAIVRRVQPASVIGAGLGLAALGFAVVTAVGAGLFGLAGLVSGCVLLSLGLGPVYTLGSELVVGAAPPERAGAAAAISETSSELGGALGIAILGSIGTAVYRGAISRAALAGVPAAARLAARDTLGGAAAAAAHLPSDLGAQLLTTGRAAFAQALEVTAGLCTLIAAATAAMALVMLRKKRPAVQGRHGSDQARSGQTSGSRAKLATALSPDGFPSPTTGGA